jgi:hypothetical protein
MGTVSSEIQMPDTETLLASGFRVLADTDTISKGDIYEFLSPEHYVPVPDDSEYTGITVKEFRQKYYNITRAQHAWKLRVVSK